MFKAAVLLAQSITRQGKLLSFYYISGQNRTMAKETYKEKYLTLLEANTLREKEFKKISSTLSRLKKDNEKLIKSISGLTIQAKLNTAILNRILLKGTLLFDQETAGDKSFEYITKLKKEILGNSAY
jgi:hypothetical protein